MAGLQQMTVVGMVVLAVECFQVADMVAAVVHWKEVEMKEGGTEMVAGIQGVAFLVAAVVAAVEDNLVVDLLGMVVAQGNPGN